MTKTGTLIREFQNAKGDNMESWHSYPKVYNLGHPAIAELLKDDVIAEEKVDGSQFSFGLFDHPEEGEVIRCRSKGAQLNIVAPDKMFQRAVDTVTSLRPLLHKGWTYRCEYLQKPKHNSLAYDRVPEKHLIVFDVNPAYETYLPYGEKRTEAERIGLECVALLTSGTITDAAEVREFLERTSALGGQPIEGVVIKNYTRFGRDAKALMGKFVSEKFKEIHAGEWKKSNPKQGDILERLIEKYKTPARWEKSYQHLREAGKIEYAAKDIGQIMKEVPEDILEECREAIKGELFNWAWSHIRRGVTGGLPQWYKEKLLERQLNAPEEESE